MPSEDFCPDCTWFSITVRLNPMLLTKFTQVFLLVFSKVDEIYCCFLKKKKKKVAFALIRKLMYAGGNKVVFASRLKKEDILGLLVVENLSCCYNVIL